MKSSKEMADAVFRIRDAYAEKKNKRKIIIKRTALVCSTVCMFGLIFAALKLTTPEKPHPVDSGIIVETETAPSESDDTPTMPSTIAQSPQSTTAATQTTATEADGTLTSVRSTTSAVSTTTASAHTTTAATASTRDEAEAETEWTTASQSTTALRRTTAKATPSPELNTNTEFVMTCAEVTVGTVQVETTVATTSVENLEVYQRFSYLEYNKKTYTTKGWEASSMEVGELIDSTVFVSDDSLISCNAQIYEFVSGIEAGAYPIVLKFEGYDGYWIYWRTL
ncbi:MAG: hypothetical protein K6G82_06785 [Ruminococcus sp.]|nr:hypothetical protein [Ruminococcus sp.]